TLKIKGGQTFHYDILILSLGTVPNYFGIPGMEEYSFSIKSLHETEKLKSHLHRHLVDKNTHDANYIIIGGGPTGVELAGALPGYIKYLRKQHGIKTKRKVHVDLVEAAPRLMPRM